MQVQVRGAASGKPTRTKLGPQAIVVALCGEPFSLRKHYESAFRSLLMKNEINSEYIKCS